MSIRVVLFILMCSMTSCGYLFWTEVECRDFKSDRLELFPGEVSDSVSFVLNDSIIQYFRIRDKRIYHTTEYISDTGCSCHDIIQLLYTNGQDSIWAMYQSSYIYDQKEQEYFEIFFVIDGVKNGFTEVHEDSTFTGKYFNNNRYPEQRKYIREDNNEENAIQQCIYSNKIGLLEFRNALGDHWTRTNIQEPKTDINTFEYLKRTCD